MADETPVVETPEQADAPETPVVETPVKTEPVKQKGRAAPPKTDAAPAAEPADVVGEIDEAELAQLRADAAAAKTARQQLAELNKQLKALQTENDGFKREKLSEQEKLQADAQAAQEKANTLEQKLRAASARVEIGEIARELKVSPRTAEKLILSAVQFDDEGQPTNVRELIEAEIAADPNLVARPTASAAPVNGDANRRDRPVLTRESIAAMSPEEINRRWAEIEPILAGAGSSR